MTLAELRLRIEVIMIKYPEAANSEVLVDTEARCFHAHMIDATGIYYEPELCEAVGDNHTYITLDYQGTTFS